MSSHRPPPEEHDTLEPPVAVRAGLARIARLLGAHVYAGELRADGSFRETFAGPGLDELLGGLPPGEDAHAAWWAAIHPDDRETVLEMHAALARGETVEAEYRVVGLDGVVRRVLDRMQPRPAPGGRVLVDGIALDVGEPGDGDRAPGAGRSALRAAARRGRRHAARARRLGLGAGARHRGRRRPRPAGRGVGCRRARERRRPASWRRASGCARGEPTDVAYRLVGLDGRERVVLDRATPWPGPDGSVLAAGIVVDVTGERRARTELEETQRRLETVLAAVAEVVFTEQLLDDGGRPRRLRGAGAGGPARRRRRTRGPAGDLGRGGAPGRSGRVEPPAWPRSIAASRTDLEHRLLGLDGVERWVALRSRPRHDPAGRRLVDGIATDVTARRQAADVVAERERRLRSLVEAIDDVVLTVELEPPDRLRPVLVGHGLERLLGGPVPARADPVEIWRAALHPEDRPAFAAALRSCAELGRHRPRAPRRRPRRRRAQRRVARTAAGGRGRARADRGHAVGRLGGAPRVHAIERAHADAEERSRVDALTGLGNRLRLEEELAGARGAVAVLGLDVDHFKRVNDTYGHAVGDEVLVEVAQRLRGAVRATDVVARPGGEEFTVLVPHLPDDAALLRIGDALRRAVGDRPFPTTAGPLDITVSIGAARRGAGGGHARRDAARRRRRCPLRREAPRPQPRRRSTSGLTDDDRVAEEPTPLRLARALALAAGVPWPGRGDGRDRGRRGGGAGPGPADAAAARAAAWLVCVDGDAVRAVRELADVAPALERWRRGEPEDGPIERVLARLPLAS